MMNSDVLLGCVARLGMGLAALSVALVSVETASGAWTNPLVGGFDCDHVFVEADCIKAVGSSIRKDKKGGGVSVGGVHVTNVNEACPKFKSACLHTYTEANDLPGFQRNFLEVRDYYERMGMEMPSPPTEPDDGARDYCGEVGTPSTKISIASFTNTAGPGKVATHWELRTKTANDTQDRFSGTF